MKRVYLFLVLVLLAFSATAAAANSGARHFIVDLEPLNGSGVGGTVHLTLEGGVLTVRLEATGLEANRPHPQHIHGHMKPVTNDNGNATCPTPAADADGDDLVSVGEGLPNYGPVLIPLPTSTTADGNLAYTATFTDLSAIQPANTLQNRAIVLHGMSVNGVYIGSLPVACGQIRPAPNN